MGRFPFYAVKQGRTVGIFDNWGECKASINRFPDALYRGVFSIEEGMRFIGRGEVVDQVVSHGSHAEGSRAHNVPEGAGDLDICYLEFDGSSRGNPRRGGGGGILYNGARQIVYEIRLGLGDVTNNEAEYLVLIHGMRSTLQLGMRRLRALGDSQLIVCQVGGDMKVGSALGRYHCEVMLLARCFEVFEISEISRAENALADGAAKDGLEFPVVPFVSEFP